MKIQVTREGESIYDISEDSEFKFSTVDQPGLIITILASISGDTFIQKNREKKEIMIPGIFYVCAGLSFILLDDETPDPIDYFSKQQ